MGTIIRKGGEERRALEGPPARQQECQEEWRTWREVSQEKPS